MTRPSTIKLYDGPSELDGKRIVVLLTGLRVQSSNTKTGHMLQTWILRHDEAPHTTQKTGKDASVCGNCPLRPALFNKGEVSERSCYVRTFQAPRSTWAANRNLPVTPLPAARALIGGRNVRRGSYGDPAAVPVWVWLGIADVPGTGYTHQWQDHSLQGHVMASIHTPGQRKAAKARGYRTFRVLRNVRKLQEGEILCPASKEAGAKTTCAKCGLCNGARPDDKRKDIAIVAH